MAPSGGTLTATRPQPEASKGRRQGQAAGSFRGLIAIGLLSAYGIKGAVVSNTTYETLAIERPEPETKLSNRAPELKDSSTRKSPRNSHRLAARLIKTGSLPGWIVRSLLTAPVLGPWPQRTTCGAAGLNFWLRQAATILPPCVGKHDTLLPPTSAWISSRVYWLPTKNISASSGI